MIEYKVLKNNITIVLNEEWNSSNEREGIPLLATEKSNNTYGPVRVSGKNIKFYDKSLSKYKLPKIVKFNKKLLNDVQIVFTALPNGEAQDLSKHLSKNHTLIDLAADFRLNKASDYLKWYKQKHRAPKLIKKSIYSVSYTHLTLPTKA